MKSRLLARLVGDLPIGFENRMAFGIPLVTMERQELLAIIKWQYDHMTKEEKDQGILKP